MPKKSKQADLKQRIDELTEDLKRVHADFVNYKRRQEEENAQIMNAAKEAVIVELLPILDDINRALGHIPKKLEKDSWAVGVSQIAKQAKNALANLGVEVIPAEGEVFNPELHEAVSFEDGTGNVEVVVEEILPGYKIGDRILRPSTVKVAKRNRNSHIQH